MPDARRIDQWLFFARIVKSRSLAQKLVEAGHVRINRAKVLKPGHDVKPGDVITAAVHDHVRVLKVLAPGARRGPAPEAQGLYEEVRES
jgi:ribosome-associated heat shock protein Hsp15